MADIIAIDIGGTNIKYGIIDHEGHIKNKGIVPTEAYNGGQALMDKVQNIVKQEIDHTSHLLGIGVSSAGQIEPKTGSVRFATDNLPGWTGMPIKDILTKRFNVPVYVDNDVNCAALGEFWQGAAQHRDDIIMITLGTGIGGAIVKEGRIFYGADGAAGEFGHMMLYPDGIRCTCGLNGCYEQYASTNALIRMFTDRLNEGEAYILDENVAISGKDIFEAEKHGDRLAMNVINEWITYISWGLSIIVHSLNPSTIIIGGGVSAQGKEFIDRIKKKTIQLIMPSFAEHLSIKPAELSNDAGIIGAAYGVMRGDI
ncbi:ROK family protein [Xylanivirga thermophila]|uniref:ROK family protein n=1 Tax=Xylanivirga thermophila TaxID=2496273 RepID=UPI0013EB88C9|nr:ROK family protein [Xylanivirga thermophila]